MRIIKSFNNFINESKSITISMDQILNFFKKKLVFKDIFDLNLPKNINDLYLNTEFIDKLINKNLKKGELQDSNTFEMLVDDRYKLTFFLIFHKDDMKIEEPEYIFIQSFDNALKKLSEIYFFENNNNINGFYQLLTDANIEIKDKDKTYVYSTSNAGNNYDMMNMKMVDKKHPKSMDSEEMRTYITNHKTN